jgi:hypothetical protein
MASIDPLRVHLGGIPFEISLSAPGLIVFPNQDLLQIDSGFRSVNGINETSGRRSFH